MSEEKMVEQNIQEMIEDCETDNYPYSEFFDSDDIKGKELW